MKVGKTLQEVQDDSSLRGRHSGYEELKPAPFVIPADACRQDAEAVPTDSGTGWRIHLNTATWVCKECRESFTWTLNPFEEPPQSRIARTVCRFLSCSGTSKVCTNAEGARRE